MSNLNFKDFGNVYKIFFNVLEYLQVFQKLSLKLEKVVKVLRAYFNICKTFRKKICYTLI